MNSVTLRILTAIVPLAVLADSFILSEAIRHHRIRHARKHHGSHLTRRGL